MRQKNVNRKPGRGKRRGTSGFKKLTVRSKRKLSNGANPFTQFFEGLALGTKDLSKFFNKMFNRKG